MTSRHKRAGERMIAALDRLGEVLRKEYDPNQPRVAAGGAEGRHWAQTDETDEETPLLLQPPIIVPAGGGTCHNQGPSLDEPPQRPPEIAARRPEAPRQRMDKV